MRDLSKFCIALYSQWSKNTALIRESIVFAIIRESFVFAVIRESSLSFRH